MMPRIYAQKTLVIFSGGADSTTLLYDVIESVGKENVGAVYFSYGQRHGPGEILAVENISKVIDLPVAHLHVDLAQFGRSALTDPAIVVPKQEEKQQGKTVVPFRNTMMLVMAAAKATIENYDCLAVGFTFEDLAEYPDCRPEYVEAMVKALRLADRHHHLTIYAPYIDLKKELVIARGQELGVPYELTHTCYNGIYRKPCRECDACKEREASFTSLGLVDPLTDF